MKTKTKYAVGFTGSVTDRLYSHSHGWHRYVARISNAVARFGKSDLDDVGPHNSLVIDMGVNWTSGLNLFGGANDAFVERLEKFMAVPPKQVFWFNMDKPPVWIVEALRKRQGKASSSDKLTDELVGQFGEWIKQTQTFNPLRNLKRGDNLTIGDSHTLSAAFTDDVIARFDGWTLYNATTIGPEGLTPLEERLIKLLPDHYYGDITVVLGSVDIRHHLLRHEHPKETLSKMIDYVQNDLFALLVDGFNFEGTVSYHAPVPVESSSRKLPKTGYYKGTPFYGSEIERRELTALATAKSIQAYPFHWYGMDPVQYENDIMERPRSVHVAPKFYRSAGFGRHNICPVGHN